MTDVQFVNQEQDDTMAGPLAWFVDGPCAYDYECDNGRDVYDDQTNYVSINNTNFAGSARPIVTFRENMIPHSSAARSHLHMGTSLRSSRIQEKHVVASPTSVAHSFTEISSDEMNKNANDILLRKEYELNRSISYLEEKLKKQQTVADYQTFNLHPNSLGHVQLQEHSAPVVSRARGSNVTVPISAADRKSASNCQPTETMFTQDDIEGITHLQINHYLTLEQRKNIGSKVLSSKMLRGYTLAVVTNAPHDDSMRNLQNQNNASNSLVCQTCDMPMLCKRNHLLKSCVVCPVMKKYVLKQILASTSFGAKTFDHQVDVNDETQKEMKDHHNLAEVRKALFHTSETQPCHDVTGLKVKENVSLVESFLNAYTNATVADSSTPIVNTVRDSYNPYLPSDQAAKIKKCDYRAGKCTQAHSHDLLSVDSRGTQNVFNSNEKDTIVRQEYLNAKLFLPPSTLPPILPTRSYSQWETRPPRSSSNQRYLSVSSNRSITSNESHRSSSPTFSPHSQHSTKQSNTKSASCRSIASQSTSLSIASTALLTINGQIEDTTRKMMQTQSIDKQIAYAELLAKLSNAAVAVKKLEELK